jgi:beta-xylosidase
MTPILPCDFADPSLLRAEGYTYAYATTAAGIHIQVARFDGRRWEYLGDALPDLPNWVRPGQEWAPKVLSVHGWYLLYYCAACYGVNQHALGVALSMTPYGPFVPDRHPLLVGFIDPDIYRDDDGSLYLLYAGADVTQGAIWSQRLTPNGRWLMGEPVKVLQADGELERGVVEAPALTRAPNGAYTLLYSVAPYDTEHYAIHYATSLHPLRPFWKPYRNVVLAGPDGPGHCDVLGDQLIYHRWIGPIGYPDGHREAFITRLGWNEGRPVCPEPGA